MNEKFASIMELHESEDKSALSDKVLRSAVLKEFSNGALILAEADKQGYTLAEFMRRGTSGLKLSFMPMRTSSEFSVKKHTSTQRPYMHAHDFYELIYVKSGKCIQRTDGGILTVERGELCVIPPDKAHMIERCGKCDVILKMIVPVPLFLKSAKDFTNLSEIKKIILPRTAEYIISKLAAEEFFRDNLHEGAVQSYLFLLFAEASRAENPHDSIEISLLAYIKENIKFAKLEDFARRSGYNPVYLSRLIKARTGRSFSEIVTQNRIIAAKNLLAETDMSVCDIAAETGYANPSGFYRQFSAFCGMTPAEYRKSVT